MTEIFREQDQHPGANGGDSFRERAPAARTDEPWRSAWEGMNQARQLLAGGETSRGMQVLFSSLRHTRSIMLDEEWKRFCEAALAHPVRELVHQDPIARRSFSKPRGYAGDAVLLDLMYQQQTPERARASQLGQEICQYMYEQPSAISLRGRRDLLAQRIDTLADQNPDARILALACGHLREAHLSRAVRERRLGRFLAIDQDPLSLDVVERELGPLGIEATPGSVKQLLKGQLRFADLDFVYAAGLYDYLPQHVAIPLTRVLFSMLRSGGRLLLANYTDDPDDSGCKAYMESFMDWWLLYREEQDVEQWSQDIPRKELAHRHLFRDDVGCILYSELVRR